MRRKRARSSGKEGCSCPPLPLTYSLVGCEAEGADVGIYCAHGPTTPTFHDKVTARSNSARKLNRPPRPQRIRSRAEARWWRAQPTVASHRARGLAGWPGWLTPRGMPMTGGGSGGLASTPLKTHHDVRNTVRVGVE